MFAEVDRDVPVDADIVPADLRNRQHTRRKSRQTSRVTHRENDLKKDPIIRHQLRSPAAIVLLSGCLIFGAKTLCAQPNYERADQRALSAPIAATKSLAALAAYLTGPFSRSDEKARAIFRWVAENIDYDVKEFFSGTIARRAPGDVLASRKAVCEGYSGIFEQLARAAGLEAVSISGFAKGYGYSSGGKLSAGPNHAWNAVRIDGAWKLIDCTWGAGHIGDSRDYVRKFSSHYFFTPPAEFIYDHFPEDPRWQLLDPPRSRAEYAALVYLRPKFFSLGMHDISTVCGVIEVSGEEIITVQAPENVVCMGTLEQRGKPLRGSHVFVQRNDGSIDVRIQPPGVGDFVFRLFAKNREEAGVYEWAAEYSVRVRSLIEVPKAYPKVYAAFDEHAVVLSSPFQSELSTRAPVLFRVRIPGAEEASIIMGQEWVTMKKEGESFDAIVHVRKGLIRLGARFPGRREFDTLLEYNGVDK